MKDLNYQFLQALAQCSDPLSFVGVARVLKIDLMKPEQDQSEGADPFKPFEVVLREIMDAYAASPRSRKRKLLKILRDSNYEASIFEPEGDLNAGNTEDTETPVQT